MPTFIPEHTPPYLEDFTRGYVECLEWLLSEDIDRDSIEGFDSDSMAKIESECAQFVESHADLLRQYVEVTGRDMASAGHDLYLTRNRHGAGFWDRGSHPCLRELTDSAHAMGETHEYLTDGKEIASC